MTVWELYILDADGYSHSALVEATQVEAVQLRAMLTEAEEMDMIGDWHLEKADPTMDMLGAKEWLRDMGVGPGLSRKDWQP